jgi:competence protein ComEC
VTARDPLALRAALEPDPEGPDLRTTLLGSAAWAGALLGLHASMPALAVLITGLVVVSGVAWRRTRMMLAGCLLTTAVLAGSAAVRVQVAEVSPLSAWAEERAAAEVVLVVTSDPVLRAGQYGEHVVLGARLESARVRGQLVRSRVPVLVIGGPEWEQVALGSTVRFTGRLGPSRSDREAAVLSGQGHPALLRAPPGALTGAQAVRTSVREAAAGGPAAASELVPALVTGDDAGLPAELVDDFRTAGLTHLTAVSGTNLTLVLAFLLLVARWSGVRGRGLLLVGLLGVVGFVLMARPEPSVVRAAAMGTVALLGLGAGGRSAGVRALGAAVLALLVLDPWLAVSPGFTLSVLATSGILFVAPGLRDAMSGWLPRPVAEAVAVPLAAQLACTPVVAALSGEVSLVAVAANLLAAPAVGPATVLGLLGGLLGLLVPPVGALVGLAATWCAQLIVVVARHAAALPSAALDWSTSETALAVLTLLTASITVLAHRLLRRPGPAIATALLLAVVILRPFPTLGWPPPGWVLVMCDVGQGDALVVATGSGEGVVVDAGPDPELVDRCLDRLGVEQVPTVVLTHFHADHVDGLPGVLRGREVAEVEVTALRDPDYGAVKVEDWAREAGVPVRVPAYGEEVHLGDVSWQVLGPSLAWSESPNDASVVLLVETAGIRLLLSGDVEPPSQAALLRQGIAAIDVLKVPHHGSAYQDERLLTSLGARVALVSVGEDNDYGHPDPGTLGLLEQAGMTVRRTDEDGDVAVVVDDEGTLRVVTEDG